MGQYLDVDVGQPIWLNFLSIIPTRLNQQMDSLMREEEKLSDEFAEIQDKEKEFLKTLTTKYGEGTLDPETGVFTKS